MSGHRAFDDDRWPDQEGFAHCFMCGRVVDPRDPRRGTYTGNAKVGGELPVHLPCVEGKDMTVVYVAWSTALSQMGEANVKAAIRNAGIAPPPAH